MLKKRHNHQLKSLASFQKIFQRFLHHNIHRAQFCQIGLNNNSQTTLSFSLSCSSKFYCNTTTLCLCEITKSNFILCRVPHEMQWILYINALMKFLSNVKERLLGEMQNMVFFGLFEWKEIIKKYLDGIIRYSHPFRSILSVSLWSNMKKDFWNNIHYVN